MVTRAVDRDVKSGACPPHELQWVRENFGTSQEVNYPGDCLQSFGYDQSTILALFNYRFNPHRSYLNIRTTEIPLVVMKRIIEELDLNASDFKCVAEFCPGMSMESYYSSSKSGRSANGKYYFLFPIRGSHEIIKQRIQKLEALDADIIGGEAMKRELLEIFKEAIGKLDGTEHRCVRGATKTTIEDIHRGLMEEAEQPWKSFWLD